MNYIVLYIFIAFNIFILIQFLYFYLIYFKFVLYKKDNSISPKQPVSVIIACRNDAHNLKKNLPFIIEQNYPEFEVIVVNDASEDETGEILKSYSNKYINLVIRTIPKESKKYFKGKKLALTIGIKAAKYDCLLFTDTDCIPAGSKWIETMVSGFSNNKEIVLGFSGYHYKKGFLNNLIQYDTFYTALQYFSYALTGLPYMGVGRNLAYTKNIYYKNKGFKNHAHIHFGDDDLFVNENATKDNVSIVIDKAGQTFSEPETSFKQWFQKKRRHFVSGKFYKKKHKLLLSLEPVSRVLIFLLLPILLLTGNTLIVIISLSLFLLLITTWVITFYYAQKKISIRNILISSLFLHVIAPVIYFIIHVANKVSRKTIKWK
ncbi:MAG: glycosyltransferase [Marinilabiliales bacterium]